MSETVAHALTTIARGFKIPALIGFDPSARRYVYRETPSSIFFPVLLRPGTKIQPLQSLSSDMERELCERFGRSDLRLFVQSSPPAIELLKPEPSAIFLTDSTLRGLSEGTTVIGERYMINKTQLVGVDIGSPETAHVIVSGMSGSGKSNVLKTLLSGLCYSTSPERLRIFGIDMKNRGLKFLSSFPHLEMAVATNDVDALEVISTVERILDARVQDETNSPIVLLVVDEMSEFTEGDLAKALWQTLPKIARQGRELRVHIVATIHRPTVTSFGGDFLSQFGAKILGKTRSSREASTVSGIPDSGAEKLTGRGNMVYYKTGSEALRFQAYLADGADDLVKNRWASSISRVEKMEIPAKIAERSGTLVEDVERVRGVAKEFVDFADGTYTVKRGGWSALARALGTTPGGSTLTRTQAALDVLAREIS